MEYGSDDMGGLSFGSGAHAEVKMDHYNNLLELADELDALTTAARAAEPEDTKLLNWLREESCDLRCIDVPTGQGDGDVHWVVVGHYQAQPIEREVGRSYSDEPREAIRDAMRAASPTPPTGTSKGEGTS